MQGGSTYNENCPLTINRDGFHELAFFACYAHFRDDHGKIVGLIIRFGDH
jgi:hypothetical protein